MVRRSMTRTFKSARSVESAVESATRCSARSTALNVPPVLRRKNFSFCSILPIVPLVANSFAASLNCE